MPLVHLLAALASIAFADSTALLDSPRFADRDAASRRLARHWPFTAPLCLAVAWSTSSPEVCERAAAVLERGSREAGRRLQRAMAAADDEAWDAAIAAMVSDPCETAGLPWARPWMETIFIGHEGAWAAEMRLVERGRREGWLDRIWCWSPEYPGEFGCRGVGSLYDLSELRFAVRGLPLPSDWIRRWNYRAEAWPVLQVYWRVLQFLPGGVRCKL